MKHNLGNGTWSYDDETGKVTIEGYLAPPDDDPNPIMWGTTPIPTYVITFAADVVISEPDAPVE